MSFLAKELFETKVGKGIHITMSHSGHSWMKISASIRGSGVQTKRTSYNATSIVVMYKYTENAIVLLEGIGSKFIDSLARVGNSTVHTRSLNVRNFDETNFVKKFARIISRKKTAYYNF